MEISELKAEKREAVGKESSKKLRQQGLVPAVVYSGGNALPITVNAREFSTLTHSGAGTHIIVKLKVAGVKKHPNAVIKEVQRNAVKNEYFHIDFQEIALDEKITASLPLTVVGESLAIKGGGVLEHHLWEVEVEGLPANMPDHIEIDISELQIGDSLHVGDLKLPENSVMITDSSIAVLAISAPRTAEAEAALIEGTTTETATEVIGETAST